MPYIQVKLKITPNQQKQALKGAKIKLTPDAIGNGEIVMLHSLNAKKIAKVKNGVILELSPGEIMNTAALHNLIPPQPEGLTGEGIFDSIWSGLKSVGKWLKDSGTGKILADVAQTIATPFVGEDIAKAGREAIKTVTGVGIGKKKMIGKGLYLGNKGSGLYL